MNRTLIVDANNLIIRNVMATALEDLQANGLFTGGIYGTLRSLRLLVSMPDVQFDRVYAFFDYGVPPRRLRLIPGYKQARKERRERLSEEDRQRAFTQVAKCYHLLPKLGVRCLVFKDREADDGVAALVQMLIHSDAPPIVVSSDADLLQTVRLGAEVWEPLRGNLVTLENFEEMVGVPPEFFVLYRTLVGDTSDSIEGLRGCGPKRATELLTSFAKHFEYQLPPHPRDRTPVEQLDDLVAFLCASWKESKGDGVPAWERSIVAHLPRLRRIAQGIDLSCSWGPRAGLEKAANLIPAVDPRGFLAECKKLQMRSVLGDPEGYLRPFRKVQERRLGTRSKARV